MTSWPVPRSASRVLALALLLILGAAQPARAQVLIGMALGKLFGGADKVSVGFDIGANLSGVSNLEGSEPTHGFMFGLFGTWRFSKHFYLHPELIPKSSEGAKNADPIPLGDPTLDPLIAGGTMSRQLNYFNIPVIVQWAPKGMFGFHLGTGPQLNFLMSGHDDYEFTSPYGTDATLQIDIAGPANTVDFGWAFDAEYWFPKTPIALALRYYQGFTDVLASPTGQSTKNWVLTGSGRIALGMPPKKKEPAEGTK